MKLIGGARDQRHRRTPSGRPDRRGIYSLVIPRRTLTHRRTEQEPLSREESDRAVRLARLAALAEQVFADPERAWHWLRTSKRQFEGRSPLQFMATEGRHPSRGRTVAAHRRGHGCLTARGKSPSAFGERCIPPRGVAHRSNTPGILAFRALRSGRIVRLGATTDFHHGLLSSALWRISNHVSLAGDEA